jgi:single-strand DNA-binding protein
MPSFNKVILMGNLTRDPELKTLPRGKAVCELSLAVNKTWKDDNGQKQERTSFFGCSAFGSTAENLAKYFSKGKPILIEGELTQETWEDKETGKKREKTKVRVERFEFVGGNNDNRGGGDNRQGGQSSAPRPDNEDRRRPAYKAPLDELDDQSDIPF